MTLEQTTEQILEAAEALDLEALRRAQRLRAEAIEALASLPATPGLRDAVAASIAAGEAARRAIQAIKRRIRSESRRLATIEVGFVRAQGAAAAHRVDCRG